MAHRVPVHGQGLFPIRLLMPVTLLDIAQSLGVSKAAVSSVLNGKAKQMRISDDLADRIHQRAAEMDYRPSAAARAIITGRTHQVGILIPNTPEHPKTSPNAYEFIIGINHRLQPMGYVACIVRVTDVLAGQDSARSRIFDEKVLDGVILIGASASRTAKALEMACRYWSSSLLLDTTEWSEFNCLRRDEQQAGRMAAEKAIRAGYEKILWTGQEPSSQAHYSMTDRYRGIIQAAGNAGVPVEHFPSIDGFDASTAAAQVQAFKALLAKERLAIVAYNHYQAIRYATLAAEIGAKIGQDFGIVCCEDAAHLGTMWPTLSRVGFDRFEIGGQAADLWLKILSDSAHRQPSVTFESQWIPGNTL